ncbi:outer membrane lipoprotein carrier protein LolA [Pyxidicoccus fallax]|uniref:Outer membrane lipoprotein carrier protein LolA n=1 Tax=Pyxidicoccus fallax TaxID=394095 RepID=A0A848LC70_9BACT|nr:outer membrane lipoprotein carrier protein LolA [Pyxidicoccus fallax]NMO15832.1 outer membrane lipoprotein carrier protein LolA [Pyxidicoccus fallax]NPC85612.1 outer membrane lipoprotein carrier protein LolA [Pyxidicoccus fallax]
MFLETLLATLLSVPAAPASPAAPAAAPVKPAVVAQAAPAAKPTGEAAKAPEAGKPATPPAAAPQPGKAPEAKPAQAAAPAAKPAPMTPEVKTLVDRMQAFYEKTGDFRAGFRQDYKYKTFRRTQTSEGTVTYKKPGLMRWEYQKPSARTFVLAGNKVYAHDPAAQTLTVANVDTSQLSASVTFLFGQGKLADEFAITKGTCKDCKGTLLVLDPLKPEPRFRQVRLEVDPASAQVLKSTVVDPDGSENAISFLNLKTNVGIAADSFKLDVPDDTRVDDFTKAKKQ